MDVSFYLNEFQKAADRLDKKLLTQKEVETSVAIFGEDCVVLKLYKKSWANITEDPLTSPSRIFFSVWISDSTIKEQKIAYNTHALKLRNLKGYSIQSRKFAETFRSSFKMFEPKWENVKVNYGPLTLMEGWIKIDSETFQNDIFKLANDFLEIEYLIDDTLIKFK